MSRDRRPGTYRPQPSSAAHGPGRCTGALRPPGAHRRQGRERRRRHPCLGLCIDFDEFHRGRRRLPAVRKAAEQVWLRDRVCRFPGCRHAARTCDLDHRVPFSEGGPTTAENLDALCRFHHRLKTFSGWRAARASGNRLNWTTPLGAVVTDHAELPPSPTSPPAAGCAADDPPPF